MNELAKKDYVALGRAILCGEPLPSELIESVMRLADEGSRFWGKATQEDCRATFVWLIYPLGLWYLIIEDLKKWKYSEDSVQWQMAKKHRDALLSVIAPRVVGSILSGDADSILRLAWTIKTAQTIPSLGNLDGWDKSFKALARQLGMRNLKFQRKTQWLRALLPLWFLGFGELTYTEKCVVFEGIGIDEKMIPEEDTLRKFVSDHRIPALLRGIK